MSAKNLPKFVNLIETNVNEEQRSLSGSEDIKPVKQTKIVTPEHRAKFTENRETQQQTSQGQQPLQTPQSSQSRHSSLTRTQPRSRLPPSDDILFPEPTFSERFMRYFWIVVYLCGLCSLGFVLSIYHLFFWDSRMPPVYKPGALKKPIFPSKPPGAVH